MSDNGLAHLHRRPLFATNTSVARLTVTINGDIYQSIQLASLEQLEDERGVRGLLFTIRADKSAEG